jgi:hypothetical protein
MQKWEYCAIVGITITSGGRLVAGQERFIHHFNEVNVRVVKVNADDQNALAQAIAGLGAEGWEMVGCGNGIGDGHVIYFKRSC